MDDISIDFNNAIKKQLIRSLELEKYKNLISSVYSIDISQDKEFQKAYDGFYNVRRKEAWRKEYFLYFEELKSESSPTFGKIIKELNIRLNSVEPSFSSKMLATLNPKMPIWDSRVLNLLGLTYIWEKERTVGNAICVYNSICCWYDNYMKSDEARKNTEMFDRIFSEYKNISDLKKIDYLLWCMG